MSRNIVYESGVTVRIECEFRDKLNNLIDPSTVNFIIYDYRHNILQTINSDIVRTGLGKYFYDYTTTLIPSRTIIYYEFNGTIGGSMSLKRGKIETVFKVE